MPYYIWNPTSYHMSYFSPLNKTSKSFSPHKNQHSRLGHLLISPYTSYKDDTHLYPYLLRFLRAIKKNHAYQNMSPCHFNFDILDKSQACPDTLYWMLIGYCVISNFSRLPFQQSYWLPQHMAIYKPCFTDCHFRKHVTLHMIILSKSLIIMNNSSMILYHCIL